MKAIGSFVISLLANISTDIGKEIFKRIFPTNVNDEIEKAYKNALDKWCQKEGGRDKEALKSKEYLAMLQAVFEDKEKLNDLPESTKELLTFFENELSNNDITRYWLESTQHQAIVNAIMKAIMDLHNDLDSNKNEIKDIDFKVDKILAILRQNNLIPPHFLTNPPANADESTVICREIELNNLEDKLKTNKALLLVNGFGGIGKSSLARLFFHKVHAQYDEVAWINYNKSLRQSFSEFNFEKLDFCKTEEERFNAIMRLANDGKKNSL